MIQISENIKRTRIKEELARRIVNGEFSFGERFPGLHDLSREYSVSYVTVSKAVKLLESEGYLRCQKGIGHFVCYVKPDQVTTRKVVNFIVGTAYYHVYRHFFTEGARLFRGKGWEVNLLRIRPEELYSLVSHINSPEAYSILCAFNVNWERFTATFGHIVKRVVVLGKLSGNPEITSIVADEYETVRLCMEHFASTGRKKVALVCARPRSELELLRIAAWRNAVLDAGLSQEWVRSHCLSLDLETNSDAEDQVFKVFCTWLEGPLKDADAVILPCYCRTFAEACAARRVAVPELLSIVFIGREDKLVTAYPQFGFLDNNFEGHFACALDILEDRFRSGKCATGSWYFCPPGKIISSDTKKNKTKGGICK